MTETIIVTGSNGQLGQAVVSKLLNQGYKVIGIDKEHSTPKTYGYDQIEMDITKIEEISNFFDALSDNRNIVGLVNNAGVAVFSPFEQRTDIEIKSVVDVNITAVILMTQAFMKSLGDSSPDKRVVNIGSIYGMVAPDLTIYGDTPRVSSEIYGMTKAAIINFTQYLASYYRGHNARFNCVSPGGIEANQGDFFKNNYRKKVPLGRMADAHEVAEVICFLLSNKSSYINGENIMVDGGFTKW